MLIMIKNIEEREMPEFVINIQNFIHSHAVAFSAGILILAYIFIAWEKISKVTIALLGAGITILLGLVSQTKGHDVINPNYFINFVDFNVIFLLVSMMIIVHITSRSGVFTWIANELLKLTKGHPIKVFFTMTAFTAFTSAFLDNVTTVILMLPIIFVIAKKFEMTPVPLLIGTIMSSNIGGTATLIGDPPNIIIGSRAGFSFMDFLNELTPIVTIIYFICMGILLFLFRKTFVATPEKMAEVANIDNSKTITNKTLMIRSMIVLGLVIFGFITHDITHLETYICAMLGASFLLIFETPDEILKDVEWNTIFFFIGLFIIIGGLEASGGIKLMAQWLLDITNGNESLTAMVILWGSGLLSGIIDNIPYTATMAPLIQQISVIEGTQAAFPLWWCLSLGACLGGNMTIIGAAANVIVSETSAAKGHKIPFVYYLKYGILITFVSLILCSIYVWLRFLMH